VWLGLWIEGFDGMEGEMEEKRDERAKCGKFMLNSFMREDYDNSYTPNLSGLH
jgi:hypothetical protein